MKFTRKLIDHCPLCLAKNKAVFKGYRLNTHQGLFPSRNYKDAENIYCCNNCSLVYNNPQIHYENGTFNEDDSLLLFTQQEAEKIKALPAYTDVLVFLEQKAKLPRGAKVFDVGTGIGRVAFALRQNGYETYAAEPRKELFDFGIRNNFTDPVRTFCKSFDELDFEAGTFDFVFLEPLNHLTDPHQAIQKALRWLKPGGYLQLEVVNSRWLYKLLLGFLYQITFRKHVSNTLGHRKPFYACEYSVKALKVYCRQNRLQICELTSHPCDTFISYKWLNTPMQWLMRRFNMGSDLSVILKRQA